MTEAPAASAAPVPTLPIATPGSALPDLEGSLKKRGKVTLIGNPWKERQFKQQREKLFYYKPGSKNPKVGSVKPSTNGGPHGIVLSTPGREWQLQADSEQQQRYWIDGLTRWLETVPKLPPASPRSVSPRPGAKEPLRNPSPMPRAASPRPEAPRYASPQKELPKPPSEPPKDQPSPRPVSPARLSLNKELPPVPAARPGSPQKRNSVSPTKGGDRTPEAPPSQELKDVLAKLDEKVRSAARYLVDEQSSLWVQNLDNVEEAIREVKAILANQSKLLGSHSEGRKAQEQQGAWCEKTAELLVKKRTRAAVSQMKAAIAFRQSMLPMSVEKKRIQEAEGHIGSPRTAAIREALNENAALLETSNELKAYRDEVLANLKELKAKLGASPAEDEEKKPDSKPEPKPEQKTEPKQEPKPEASKPAAPPASAPAGEEGRNRTTTAMELAELEREQRELERDQAALEKEQKALEEAHAQHNQALVASAAKAITAPSVAPGKIEDELAAAIVALKPFTGQHEAINALFAGLELSPAAIDAIVAAVKAKGQTIARLNDEEFGKLPDSVERPRGAADYFRLTLSDGKSHYVVVCSGAPYLYYTVI